MEKELLGKHRPAMEKERYMMKKCIKTLEVGGSLCRKELKIQGARKRGECRDHEKRVQSAEVPSQWFHGATWLQNLMEQKMKAARRRQRRGP